MRKRQEINENALMNIIKESINDVVLDKNVYQSVDKRGLLKYCKLKQKELMTKRSGSVLDDSVELVVRCSNASTYPNVEYYDTPSCYAAIIEAIRKLSMKCKDNVFEVSLIYDDGTNETIGMVEA